MTASKAAATPGPWTVVRDRHDHWGMVEVQGPGVGGFLTIGFTIATDVDASGIAKIRADAALIAAAPDLLAESERNVEYMIELRDRHLSHVATVVKALLQKRIEATQAAIAKAREPGATP